MGSCTSSDRDTVVIYQCVDDMQDDARATSVGALAFIDNTQQLYVRVNDGWKAIQLGSILSLPPTPDPVSTSAETSANNTSKNAGESKTKKPKEKPKEKKVSKLELKETNVAGVDKKFKEAVAPFNEAVELKEKMDTAIKEFKVSTGHKSEDSIKVIMLDLKDRYPNVKFEVQNGCKFVLSFGPGVKEEGGAAAAPADDNADNADPHDNADDGDDANADDAGAAADDDDNANADDDEDQKLISVEIEDDNVVIDEDNVMKAFNAIGNLREKLLDLLKVAKESAQIFEKAGEINNMVRDAGLSLFQMTRALKNTASNISEFRKVPSVVDALMKTAADFVEDVMDTIKELEGEVEEEDE